MPYKAHVFVFRILCHASWEQFHCKLSPACPGKEGNSAGICGKLDSLTSAPNGLSIALMVFSLKKINIFCKTYTFINKTSESLTYELFWLAWQSWAMTKCLRNTNVQGRKSYLTTELSYYRSFDHRTWFFCILDSDRTEHHGGVCVCVWESLPPIIVALRQRDGKRRDSSPPFKGITLLSWLPSTRCHF